MPERSGMQMGEASTPSPQGMPDSVAESGRPPVKGERSGQTGRRMVWLFGWGTKGGLAVLDQGLFAGAQFVLNILLARWLAPTEYGAFAVAYSVFLLAASVHSALLIEPMIVFGSGKHFESRRSYLGIVLGGHWALTLPAGLFLFGSGFVARLYSPPVGDALCALGVALPLLLLAWLTRRAFYIDLRPGRSAAGGVIYLLCLLALVLGVHAEGVLTPALGIAAMGVAALVTAAVQLVWLRPRWFHIAGAVAPSKVASEHWGYGRWALASALAAWVSWNVYYLALPAWFGLGAAGAMKALLNLVNPATHSLMALGMLVLPLLSRRRQQGGLQPMRRTVRRVALLFLAGASAYFLILWYFRVQVIHLVYGGRYMEYSGLPLLLAGLAPMATACSVAFGSALRAWVRPDRLFWGYLAAGLGASSLGLWFASRWGLAGAFGGYLASNAVLVAVLWFFYRRLSAEATTT